MPPPSGLRPDISDEDLCRAHLAGDVDAFRTVVQRYATPLYRFARRFTGNAEDGEDMVQETFLRLHRHLPGLRLDLPLKPWLYHVCANVCRNLAKRKKAPTSSALETPDAEGDEHSIADDIAG